MKTALVNFVPQKVAITQLGSIRDCLLSLPLAVDVKKLWPETTLVWLAESSITPLLQDHPCVDQVIQLQPGWTRQIRDWRRLGNNLREQSIDLTLDPTGLTKSAVLSAATGARARIGFKHPMARELAPWIYTHRISARMRHRLDVFRELLRPWHEPLAGNGQFEMPVYCRSREIVQEALGQLGLSESSNWYVIYPGALWPSGCWPVERFGRVARELYQRLGWKAVIVWMGESERLLSNVVAEDSGGSAVPSPALTLPESAELLRRAQFLIANDSLILHLASAVCLPCISLHGPTWADEFGGYGPNHIAIQSPHPNLSRRTPRRGPNTAMQAIEVDEVLLQVHRLLRRLSLSDSRTEKAA